MENELDRIKRGRANKGKIISFRVPLNVYRDLKILMRERGYERMSDLVRELCTERGGHDCTRDSEEVCEFRV